MKKHLLASISLLVVYGSTFSQSIDTTSLTLKGGYKAFIKAMFTTIPGLDSFEICNYSKENRTYVAQFQVQKNGSIGSNVFVYGLKDTLLVSRIVRAILKTQGLWTNHTGSDAIAILNFYYAFTTVMEEEPEIIAHEPKLTSSYYQDGLPKKYIFLQPIVIQAGPTVR